ncbi:MAG TPA: hypothetical protein PLB73_16565, partial [Leptospiraceae bacterium]|nr:hypothetical protein [Leptospiraceae bacterium]
MFIMLKPQKTLVLSLVLTQSQQHHDFGQSEIQIPKISGPPVECDAGLRSPSRLFFADTKPVQLPSPLIFAAM